MSGLIVFSRYENYDMYKSLRLSVKSKLAFSERPARMAR